MGSKVSPISFRLGVNRSWQSHWWGGRITSKYLKEDYLIRQYILRKVEKATIKEIEISRNQNSIRTIIHTARPGILIGHKGANIKAIENGIKKILAQSSKEVINVNLDVKEIKDFEGHSKLIADEIASQLERRMPFRRVVKQALSKMERNPNIKGVKVEIAGRLDGSEMGRREKFHGKGSVPLGKLRADIDYAFSQAVTKYGTIGIKVWAYKGDKFNNSKDQKEN